jgi:hypothetical protein
MQAGDWLARETLLDPAFNAFGGLGRMTNQVASRTSRCGGLQKVEIKTIVREESRFRMTVQIAFNDPLKCQDSRAAATTEPELWQITTLKEEGSWKLKL